MGCMAHLRMDIVSCDLYMAVEINALIRNAKWDCTVRFGMDLWVRTDCLLCICDCDCDCYCDATQLVDDT